MAPNDKPLTTTQHVWESLQPLYVFLGGAGVAGGAYLVYYGMLRLFDSEWYAIHEASLTYATTRHQ